METAPALWGLFSSAFVSATLAPGGSELLLAGLAATGAAPGTALLAVAPAGNTLGALTTWAVGRLAARGLPPERLAGGSGARALALVRRYGVAALLLSWLPLIGDALCAAAGWLRLPLGPGVLAIAAGKAARYAVVVWAAS